MDTNPTAGQGGAIRKLIGSLSWYVKGVLGEDSYLKYREHRLATHPGVPMLTEREFWRDKMDRQDANPQGRCC
ncbi:uncharacterized short protein YbdD (DUF466 family) [Psychromicrobium silvestre]|uniref:Uncharacterized short protein YbdD (DUF466 family) n=1 Tax=Psychromicrobium silvestre TaxID=1645614 RepID=A0A7Y9LV98_9MICC|nr:YbdD/YjiX family protein [Psychromicrobium silvestre]NYE96253.1 uncharacterized short protein YbdD (DUF466 family) [Psychromicrobium silvestre]